MKVAILGTVPTHRQLAPFRDDEWEIWVCSPGNRGDGTIPRITRWFEIHGVQAMLGPENQSWAPEYFAWLRSKSFPVYMQEPNEQVPQCKIFPWKEVIKRCRSRLPFMSQPTWMMGYALLLGAEEVALYGIDMEAQMEAYSGQKFGCLRMFEILRDNGIKVSVPLESSLCTYPPLYGYDEASRFGRVTQVKKLEVAKSIAEYDATILRLQQERAQCRGMQEYNDYIMRTFVDGEHDAELDAAVPGVEVIEQSHAEANGKTDFGAFAMDKATGLLVPKLTVQDLHPLKPSSEHQKPAPHDRHGQAPRAVIE